VAIYHNDEIEYQREYPFIGKYDCYPELSQFKGFFGTKDEIAPSKTVIEGLRSLFKLYGLDNDNYGTDEWNPLGYAIEPGMNVVIKPNLVLHKNLSGADLFCSITHPSVIVAILLYAMSALKGEGEIVIADAPQWNCDGKQLMVETKLDQMARQICEESNVKVSFRDLRRCYGVFGEDLTGIAKEEVTLDGDLEGYCDVELGESSAFWGQPWLEFIYGSDHDRSKLRQYHNQKRHAYNISKTILKSDIIINIPKIKTHKKAGLTCAMKNFVGINGDKNCLPHFRIGYNPNKLQDEMESPNGNGSKRAMKKVEHRLMWLANDMILAQKTRATYRLGSVMMKMERPLKKMASSGNQNAETGWGNWYGNKTIASTILDINNIVLFSDKNGLIRSEPQRRVINLVDGIKGGEGEGPLAPTSKNCGVLILGSSTYAIDFVVCTLMGFSPDRIPTLNLTESKKNKMVNCGIGDADIRIRTNSKELEDSIRLGKEFYQFISFRIFTIIE